MDKMKEEGWREFLRLCQVCKSSQQLDKLLDFFLTISEKEAINDRVELIKALLKGEMAQRDIAKELDVSIAKITRGSNELKRVDKQLKQFLIKQLK